MYCSLAEFHEISFGLDVVVLQLVMESYWIGKTFSKDLRNNQSTLLLLWILLVSFSRIRSEFPKIQEEQVA